MNEALRDRRFASHRRHGDYEHAQQSKEHGLDSQVFEAETIWIELAEDVKEPTLHAANPALDEIVD